MLGLKLNRVSIRGLRCFDNDDYSCVIPDIESNDRRIVPSLTHWGQGPLLITGINTLRARQNGHHFPDDIFKWIFLNGSVWISINISLKFVPMGPINNIPTLVRVMAWRRPGDKPLSEPMMVRLPTHICVTRPQWAKPACELGHG